MVTSSIDIAEDIDDEDPYFSVVFARKRAGLPPLTRDEALRLLDERREKNVAAVFPNWTPPAPKKVR